MDLYSDMMKCIVEGQRKFWNDQQYDKLNAKLKSELTYASAATSQTLSR